MRPGYDRINELAIIRAMIKDVKCTLNELMIIEPTNRTVYVGETNVDYGSDVFVSRPEKSNEVKAVWPCVSW